MSRAISGDQLDPPDPALARLGPGLGRLYRAHGARLDARSAGGQPHPHRPRLRPAGSHDHLSLRSVDRDPAHGDAAGRRVSVRCSHRRSSPRSSSPAPASASWSMTPSSPAIFPHGHGHRAGHDRLLRPAEPHGGPHHRSFGPPCQKQFLTPSPRAHGRAGGARSAKSCASLWAHWGCSLWSCW